MSREQELEARLRELVEACRSWNMISVAVAIANADEVLREVLASESDSSRRTFGKRREGLTRSEIQHPGLHD